MENYLKGSKDLPRVVGLTASLGAGNSTSGEVENL